MLFQIYVRHNILVVHAMPKYDPDKWIEQLLQCQHLPEQDMKVLCDRVRAILIEESNIQPVSTPVTICGDIHGQFWDLLELLRKGGMVPETSYIFMARMCCVWASIVVCSHTRGDHYGCRATLSTGGTTASKPSLCCSPSRRDIRTR